jgi:hypothetical protein
LLLRVGLTIVYQEVIDGTGLFESFLVLPQRFQKRRSFVTRPETAANSSKGRLSAYPTKIRGLQGW